MSGDVQPRKRKDKKKKKDDLGIEEPRGTAAALGEGDIFMHSQNEHGTGGHWCAKIIFFSLLAVLITLIGLIILENRGLTELEANSVESRYSGVLEGWLEDVGDNDHHDEHTLELHHHDEEDDDHGGELDHDEGNDLEDEGHEDDDDHEDNENNQSPEEEDEEDHNEDESQEDEEINEQDEAEQNDNEDSQENDDEQNEDSEEQNLETAEEDEDDIEERSYQRYYHSNEKQVNDDDADDDNDENKNIAEDDDDEDENEPNDDDEYNQADDNDNQESQQNKNSNENYEDENEQDPQEQDSDIEVEHIEQEVYDEDVSTEPAVHRRSVEDYDSRERSEARLKAEMEDDVELLEPKELDDDLPEILPIPPAKGRPLVEVEESSTERPPDTLADEEEYERQQEELKQQKEQASQGMWLKVVVGGALLAASHAVLRRATTHAEPESEEEVTREETPLSDRRMTLITEAAPPVAPKIVQEASRPIVKEPPAPPPRQVEENDEEEEEIVVSKIEPKSSEIDKELYSDEEEIEDEEEEEEIEPPPAPKPVVQEVPKSVTPVKNLPKTTPPIEKEESPEPPAEERAPSPEEYDDDDVEIIDDEEIEEELEEEEEISDVDDSELLTRLEAKYGRLPEPDRPGFKKDGGNSIEDEWPGEPADNYWRERLDHAEQDLREGEWLRAAQSAGAPQLRASARARYVAAKALDLAADAKRDNGLLSRAIAAYLDLLKMSDRLHDKRLVEVAERAINRTMFKGNYLGAEPIYRLLIRRFPDMPAFRNNLTIAFLMANRADLAEEVVKETLKRWPNDRLALAHHGFILKTLHNKLEEAVAAFTKALEGDPGPANEPRFFYHLGDALLLQGRNDEANKVHERGAALGHFLSPLQRSLYNVDRLKSQPWWNVEETPYASLAKALEASWKDILREGLAAQQLFEKEKEGLMERGEWTQMDLFVRGREVSDRCKRAPVTCAIVKSSAGARCRRGQVKFSSMAPRTHVRAHVGPTNCRLRMHLALDNTTDTFLRVGTEIRQWEKGKVLMFDDSFEHEVWHNGSAARLVLIVDVWHPHLTPRERAQLPAI